MRIIRDGDFQKKTSTKNQKVSHFGVIMVLIRLILYSFQAKSAIIAPIKTQTELKLMLTIRFFYHGNYKNDHDSVMLVKLTDPYLQLEQ